MNPFVSVSTALSSLKGGRMLIVVDDPKRENQADVIFPAETATAEQVNFLLTYCRGLLCVPIPSDYAARFRLPLMVPSVDNTEETRVQFTVSVDARSVTSFGISVEDRKQTIVALSRFDTSPDDFVRPGHVFPLLARDGGVLCRQGHTEATVDMMRLAGLAPVGVLCEILDSDGHVASRSYLGEFSKRFDIPMISVADIVSYHTRFVRKPPVPSSRPLVVRTAQSTLPTRWGTFAVSVYRSLVSGKEHVVLQLGHEVSDAPILVRLHSRCVTGEVFGSLKCDCGDQLQASLAMVGKNSRGILLYLDQEGRGIGLSNKIRAYRCQDEHHLDTVSANTVLGFPKDARDYRDAADILQDMGVSRVFLLTNNPDKIRQLSQYGITVARRVPIPPVQRKENASYLRSKRDKLGHLLTLSEEQ